ncbi:MAG: hypothetical protein ACM3UY_05585, partial [Methanocella sp.]
SETHNPQPVTCYTDLMRIHNQGNTTRYISLTIDNLCGTSNIGKLTIFLFLNQTNTPLTANYLLGSITITNKSSGSFPLCESLILEPSATC